MKKYILIGLFLMVVIATAIVQYNATIPREKAIPLSTISVTQIVVIDDKGGQSTLRPKRGTTALQLLSSSHRVAMRGEKENAYITGIDGKAANESEREFWAFYVNGKQAQVGAGSYLVKNNDTIEWKIETY